MRCWPKVWMTSAVLLVLAACSREQPQREAADDPSQIPHSGEPPPQLPPADSGLAIKRGVAIIASDRMTFQPCGETVELWVIDQTDRLLAESFATELRGGSVKLYLDAYGERASVVEDDAPAASNYPGTFILEEVLYASIEQGERGCAAPEPTYIVAARGNEPFWAVEVTETQMTWRQPEGRTSVIMAATPAQDAEGAVRYQAEGDGHQLELLLEALVCRDTMAGDLYAYTARAVFDGEEFKGCARVGR